MGSEAVGIFPQQHSLMAALRSELGSMGRLKLFKQHGKDSARPPCMNLEPHGDFSAVLTQLKGHPRIQVKESPPVLASSQERGQGPLAPWGCRISQTGFSSRLSFGKEDKGFEFLSLWPLNTKPIEKNNE